MAPSETKRVKFPPEGGHNRDNPPPSCGNPPIDDGGRNVLEESPGSVLFGGLSADHDTAGTIGWPPPGTIVQHFSDASSPSVSPAARTLRTLFQVLLALCATVPTTTVALGFTAATAAKIAAITGAIVVVVTAAMNALEKAGVIPTMTVRPK
jgi:hypothetical protein